MSNTNWSSIVDSKPMKWKLPPGRGLPQRLPHAERARKAKVHKAIREGLVPISLGALQQSFKGRSVPIWVFSNQFDWHYTPFVDVYYCLDDVLKNMSDDKWWHAYSPGNKLLFQCDFDNRTGKKSLKCTLMVEENPNREWFIGRVYDQLYRWGYDGEFNFERDDPRTFYAMEDNGYVEDDGQVTEEADQNPAEDDGASPEDDVGDFPEDEEFTDITVMTYSSGNPPAQWE